MKSLMRKVFLIGILSITSMSFMALEIRSAKAETAIAPIWDSAEVLIGKSSGENDSLILNCPLFFSNGNSANATYTIDGTNGFASSIASSYGNITGTGQMDDAAIAVVTDAVDGKRYLISNVTEHVNGTGKFSNVTKVIYRCKYLVEASEDGLGFAAVGNITKIKNCLYCHFTLVKE